MFVRGLPAGPLCVRTCVRPCLGQSLVFASTTQWGRREHPAVRPGRSGGGSLLRATIYSATASTGWRITVLSFSGAVRLGSLR
jgi:hypothetical protein